MESGRRGVTVPVRPAAQHIESVNQILKQPLRMEQPSAHKPDGLFTRIVQHLPAHNAAI